VAKGVTANRRDPCSLRRRNWGAFGGHRLHWSRIAGLRTRVRRIRADFS
jgi:hypothetical protein